MRGFLHEKKKKKQKRNIYLRGDTFDAHGIRWALHKGRTDAALWAKFVSCYTTVLFLIELMICLCCECCGMWARESRERPGAAEINIVIVTSSRRKPIQYGTD